MSFGLFVWGPQNEAPAPDPRGVFEGAAEHLRGGARPRAGLSRGGRSRRVVQAPQRPPRTPGPRGRGRGVPEGGRSTCPTAWRRRQPRRRQRAEQQTHTTNTRPRGSPHFVEAVCLGPPGAQPWALPTCPRASALVVWVVHQPLTQSWSSTKTRPRRQDVSAGHPQDVCCVERGRGGGGEGLVGGL